MSAMFQCPMRRPQGLIDISGRTVGNLACRCSNPSLVSRRRAQSMFRVPKGAAFFSLLRPSTGATDEPSPKLTLNPRIVKDVNMSAAAPLGVVTFFLATLAIPLPALANTLPFPEGTAFFPGLVGDDPLREGFVSAFLLIFFSEIGDKTFFIALLLALRRSKSLVFTGTFGALAVMTVISVGLGRFLHILDELVPNLGFPLDDALAVALLVFFGVQTLLSAGSADEDAEEEKGEAQEAVDEINKSDTATISLILSTFALVFAAEWGDKSFLATIALAAASDPTGVVLGAIAGHGVATVIAVLGGSFLGNYLSEKAVQYLGGSLFLIFAAATLYDIATGVH